jgi:hypothetical protein
LKGNSGLADISASMEGRMLKLFSSMNLSFDLYSLTPSMLRLKRGEMLAFFISTLNGVLLSISAITRFLITSPGKVTNRKTVNAIKKNIVYDKGFICLNLVIFSFKSAKLLELERRNSKLDTHGIRLAEFRAYVQVRHLEKRIVILNFI